MNNCNIKRRFGVEIEINAFDGRNRPVGQDFGAMPEGIHEVANIVQKNVKEKVFIQKWGNNHNNDSWILKPDSSCGIEVCTPVLKGLNGVHEVCSVVDAFGNESKIKADDRCSFHVHVDINDLSKDQIASVLTWWIKCEYIFANIVPLSRKKNKYCQLISFSDVVDSVKYPLMSSSSLIFSLGRHKYFSVNTYHLSNNKRKTIEFRIMDSSSCCNYFDAKNYILFLLHFVNITSKLPLPNHYEEGNQMTGYSWLDFNNVLDLLEFDTDKTLSIGMLEVKNWFFMRMKQNTLYDIDGIFGKSFKEYEYDKIILTNCLNLPLFNNKFLEDKFSE